MSSPRRWELLGHNRMVQLAYNKSVKHFLLCFHPRRPTDEAFVPLVREAFVKIPTNLNSQSNRVALS